MIQLLFMLILSEVAVIVALLFKNPFRKLLIAALDRMKRGRGPLVLKAVAATLVVVLLSGVYSILHIQKRGIEQHPPNPTDQVLMANHLLQSTLIGAGLFLALMIDRLHHYIRELRIHRKTIVTVKKLVVIEALDEERAKLRVEHKRLKSDLESKTKDVDVAGANVLALRKQSEGFLLEYDRLLEQNQILRRQLQFLDRKLSHSISKKNINLSVLRTVISIKPIKTSTEIIHITSINP